MDRRIAPPVAPPAPGPRVVSGVEVRDDSVVYQERWRAGQRVARWGYGVLLLGLLFGLHQDKNVWPLAMLGCAAYAALPAYFLARRVGFEWPGGLRLRRELSEPVRLHPDNLVIADTPGRRRWYAWLLLGLLCLLPPFCLLTLVVAFVAMLPVIVWGEHQSPDQVHLILALWMAGVGLAMIRLRPRLWWQLDLRERRLLRHELVREFQMTECFRPQIVAVGARRQAANSPLWRVQLFLADGDCVQVGQPGRWAGAQRLAETLSRRLLLPVTYAEANQVTLWIRNGELTTQLDRSWPVLPVSDESALPAVN